MLALRILLGLEYAFSIWREGGAVIVQRFLAGWGQALLGLRKACKGFQSPEGIDACCLENWLLIGRVLLA